MRTQILRLAYSFFAKAVFVKFAFPLKRHIIFVRIEANYLKISKKKKTDLRHRLDGIKEVETDDNKR